MAAFRRRLAVGLSCLLVTLPAVGHDSPEHVVEWLTAKMEVVGVRADLLWRRATELRSLSRLAEAERDLRSAVRLESGFMQARVDLSRVQLTRGHRRSALRTIRAALKLPGTAESRRGLHMVKADVLAALGRWEEAVAECDRALESPGISDPEWFLTRCQYQYRLGQFREAAAGLEKGYELTGNAVLEAEWIDAAIDAGDFAGALRRIEPQFELSRCQAAWLIRRGRVNAGLGRTSEAHRDFLAAIAELNGRLGGTRLDFTLLAERGLAYALLGDEVLARADFKKARENGADDWVVGRLERTLASLN